MSHALEEMKEVQLDQLLEELLRLITYILGMTLPIKIQLLLLGLLLVLTKLILLTIMDVRTVP